MAIVRERAIPYDCDTVEIQTVICDDCKYVYRKWPDGPNDCPRCIQGQPIPFGERRGYPNEFLGPDWIWIELRGPHGLWCPKREFVISPKVDFDIAVEEVRPHAEDFDGSKSFIVQLAEFAARFLAGERR